jgi:hypothetical protein
MKLSLMMPELVIHDRPVRPPTIAPTVYGDSVSGLEGAILQARQYKTKEVDTAGNSSLDMVINVVNLNLKTGSSYIGRDIDLILDSSLGKSATKSVAILAWQSINELSWSERLK